MFENAYKWKVKFVKLLLYNEQFHHTTVRKAISIYTSLSKAHNFYVRNTL